jgi:hypothetical protein
MKIFYSPYQITPKRLANRLGSMKPRAGVFIKGEINRQIIFADYFPHIPLGDRSVDEFLSEFKFQEDEYDQKVFNLLLKDKEFQKIAPKAIKNHQLWSGSEQITSSVIKYKMLTPLDKNFLTPLKNGVRLRLDFNGIFKRDEYFNFFKDIPEKYFSLIDYIEDPLSELNWDNLPIPSAMDFIEGSSYDFYIHKPNCEFLPQIDIPIIFSSYLGHNLGRWHSYCELIRQGDLKMTHGIYTPGFYEEEENFFTGNYDSSFIANRQRVNKIYQKVSDLNWKRLCSM